MKLLHLQNGQPYGGIQSMLATLATERFVCLDLEPHFALCVSGRLSEELLAEGVPVHFLGETKTRFPWQVLRARNRLRRVLDEGDFDAVISHGSWPHAVFGSVVKRAGLPLIHWMHNDTKVRHKNLVERVAAAISPDLAICNSAFTAASLPLQFDRVPPHVVIPCPVPLPVSMANNRATVRAAMGTPMDAIVILQVGRPEPWKGNAQLIEALGKMRDVPNWICWMAGGAVSAEQTAFLAELHSAVDGAGLGERVIFLGERRDVPALMAGADIFCQPNLTPEPFGIVFVEALFAGLPVVSTDHGGVCEIVDASCGKLSPPRDVDALANALTELVANENVRRELGTTAPERAALICDPARVLPQVRDAIAPLLHRSENLVEA